MRMLRRVVLVTVALLIAAPVGMAGAAPDVPAAERTAQDALTPEAICEQATEDLAEPESREFEAAEDVLQDGVDYWAVICTAKGPIYVDLLEEESPMTVNNFVFLAQNDYYNNTTFHRVLPGFMAQGGDPTGTGGGGPGYEFGDETDNGLTFDQPGLLAMANAGPGTNGSQFFITYAPTSWLDGGHTIFGRVFQGLDVAELLRPRNPEQMPDYEGETLETVVIVEDSATVEATQDGAPPVEHFQALLDSVIVGQINTQFTLDEAHSHTYDLDAEATFWGETGGDALAGSLRDTLERQGFIGTAAVMLDISECPASPQDLPIWALGFRVSDLGVSGAPDGLVFDDDRSDEIVASGAFETYADPPDVVGRVYSRPVAEGDYCGASGVYHRLELPYGRYVLTADLVLDSDYIGEDTEPTAVQYLGYVLQDLLYGSISGTLDRGNDAVAVE